jgi:hypothetical protein
LLRFVLALSPSGNPEFATIMKVVSALGLRLHVSTAAAKSTARLSEDGHPQPEGHAR